MQVFNKVCFLLLLLYSVSLDGWSQTESKFDEIANALLKRDSLTLFSNHELKRRLLVPDTVLNQPVRQMLSYLEETHQIYHVFYNRQVVILYQREANKQSKLSVANEATPDQMFRFTGRLLDASSNKPIANGTIIINDIQVVNTDTSGGYRFLLPAGVFTVKAIGPGTLTSNFDLTISSDLNVDIELFEKTVELDEVVISVTNPDVNIVNLQPGALTLEISELKQIPAFLGEIDVSRAVISLPGVSSVGEGATGFNVRGGNIDQNLILMDGITLFNSSHMLGFFSAFNPDLISDFTLYKGLIPPDKGGRVSSVLEVNQKGPNKSTIGGSASVGPLNSKLFLDLPIKEKSSGVVIGLRGSYPNYILGSFPDESAVSNSKASFYDITLKYDHEFGKNSALNADFYFSEDEFKLTEDTTFNYSNLLLGVNYNTNLSSQWLLQMAVSLSKYRAGIRDKTLNQQAKFENGISQLSLKGTMSNEGERTNQNFGFESNYYKFFTGEMVPASEQSEILPETLSDRNAFDISIFYGLQHKITDRLGFQAGLRATSFFNVGSDTIPIFDPEKGRDFNRIVDTTILDKGELRRLNVSLEPRASINFRLTPDASLKAGYSRTFQYIHLFSNTVASLPTDLWRPSDANLQPVSAHIFSLGLFKNFKENLFETSIEAFYKDMDHTIDFVNGTQVLLNPNLVFQTLQGESEAYGIELSAHKTRGKFTGRLGYTYSRAWSRFRGISEEQTLNEGDWYPANFDRPHDLNLFGNWKLGKLWSISANFVFTSGRPVSLPEQSFRLGGAIVFSEIDRNNFRVPDFHRLDFAVTLKGSNRRERKFQTSWTFSVYNVYGRKNVFSVFINGQDGRPRQLSVLGAPFPSLTFNISLN